MDGLSRVGRLVFAVAMLCFGMLYLGYASGLENVVPWPPWSAENPAVAWLAGIGFVAV